MLSRFAGTGLLVTVPALIWALAVPTVLVASPNCVDYAGHWTVPGQLDTPGDARHVVVIDRLAYVADGAAGLQIVDLANPAVPLLLRTVDTPGSAVAVAVADGYAYIADQAGDLRIVDVSSPGAAAEIASFACTGSVCDVAVAGGHVYLARAADGLQAVDVTDPLHPAAAGSLSGHCANVAAQGGVLYAGSGTLGLRVIDISTPGSPQVVATLWANPYEPGAGALRSVQAVSVAGDRGCFTEYLTWMDEWFQTWNRYTVRCFELTDPLAPVIGGGCGQSEQSSSAGDIGARGTVVDGQVTAAIRQATAGRLEIYDLANPAAPALLAQHTCLAGPYQVAREGDVAVTGAGTAGVEVRSLSDAGALSFVESRRDVGDFRAMTAAVAGQYACVGRYREYSGFPPLSELAVIDLANPAGAPVPLPVPSGAHATPQIPPRWNGSLLAAQGSDPAVGGCLMIWDVSTPALPVHLASVSPDCSAIDAQGDFVYGVGMAVSLTMGRLSVWDISTPASAFEAKRLDIPISPVGEVVDVACGTGLVYIGGCVYGVGGPFGLLKIVDVADPLQPSVVGSLTLGAPACADLAVTGSLVYFAASSLTAGRLQVIDASNPAAPVARGSCALRFPPVALAVLGTRAYVTCGAGGLAVIDVTDPDAPYLLAEVEAPNAADAVIANGRLYFTEDVVGDDLVTAYLDCEHFTGVPGEGAPASPRLLEVAPNPFNPRVTVSFTLAGPRTFGIEIYDLAGRRVAEPAPPRLWQPGRHELVWDGRDPTGRALPSGVYLVRLRGEGVAETRKVMLVR